MLPRSSRGAMRIHVVGCPGARPVSNRSKQVDKKDCTCGCLLTQLANDCKLPLQEVDDDPEPDGHSVPVFAAPLDTLLDRPLLQIMFRASHRKQVTKNAFCCRIKQRAGLQHFDRLRTLQHQSPCFTLSGAVSIAGPRIGSKSLCKVFPEAWQVPEHGFSTS